MWVGRAQNYILEQSRQISLRHYWMHKPLKFCKEGPVSSMATARIVCMPPFMWCCHSCIVCQKHRQHGKHSVSYHTLPPMI